MKTRSALLTTVQRIGPIWLAVLVTYLLFGLFSPGMFRFSHIMNMLQVASFLGTVTLGQTLVLLVGGIDLSVSAVVTLTNVALCILMNGQPANVVMAVAITLLLCLLVGLLNGFLIAVVRVTPLIVTLATNSIVFGAALVYTGGAINGRVTEGFAQIGQGYVLGCPISALVWLALALVIGWVTTRTIYGRHLYGTGANPRAAYLLTARTTRITISAYVLSSFMAFLGGVLITAYINNPSLGIGSQFQLASVAATVVGGTALTGGIGSIVGAVGGTLFMTELNSFTNMVKVSSGVQFLLQGTIIALSVLFYRLVSAARMRT